jgi:hypothetical protein
MRAGKSPLVPITPEQSLGAREYTTFASNTGNLLYFDAAFKHLSIADEQEVTPDFLLTQGYNDKNAMAERINSEFDHFVIPLSDSFKPGFMDRLDLLAELVEKLKIPVTLLSVSVKCRLNETFADVPDEVNRNAKRLVTAVLAHSPAVGVRGEITRDYLMWLGFDSEQITVIGCPSMTTFPQLKVVKRAKTVEKLGFSLHPSNLGTGKMVRFQDKMSSVCPNSQYIMQDTTDLALLLWGAEFGMPDWNHPTSIHHPLYKERRMRMYVDSRRWIAEMRNFDFIFGPRFHGCIASVLGGTPACNIAWDMRALELARYHKMPYMLYKDLDVDKLNLQELYDSLDFTELNDNIALNIANYSAFLQKQGLQFSIDNPEFEAKMAEVFPLFAKPIVPLRNESADDEALINRLRWLWQGRKTDTLRREATYMNEWDGGVGNYPAPDMLWKTRAEMAEQRISELERRMNDRVIDKIVRRLRRFSGADR